jgi:hypothetical protein
MSVNFGSPLRRRRCPKTKRFSGLVARNPDFRSEMTQIYATGPVWAGMEAALPLP